MDREDRLKSFKLHSNIIEVSALHNQNQKGNLIYSKKSIAHRHFLDTLLKL